MNKLILLPKLAFVGIKKNGITYFPYLLAGMFSVFIFFVFSSIAQNDMISNMPRSAYLFVLMSISMFLLGLILIPFLLYTNSFLIKRRKMELGLYSILGLEKKHIAIMMFYETLYTFLIMFVGGIILGVVFSKLLFLILLNLARLPLNMEFTFSLTALKITFWYFVGANLLNLVVNLVQVYKSNPNDLMKGAKAGEKSPKRLWIPAVMGLALLAGGYYIAAGSKLDSGIFLDFFLAVALVSLGTHYFFKAGIIALLRLLKGNKKFYYNKINFTTVSGMLYRMKKSASSLANICIFSTMTIITLLCTAALWFGTSGLLDFQYPFDVKIDYKAGSDLNPKAFNQAFSELSKKYDVKVTDKLEYSYLISNVIKDGSSFLKLKGNDPRFKIETIKLITLSDFNKMENRSEILQNNEVMVYSTGMNVDADSIVLGKTRYTVKKEINEAVLEPKASVNRFGQNIYFIVKDDKAAKAIIDEINPGKSYLNSVCFQLEGSDTDKKEFTGQIGKLVEGKKELISYKNGVEGREDTVSINGGLLFMGIFFGIIFAMCLLLIMYYKQITEGYDDRSNFSIMQKVGMSDSEVKGTIKRQILLVFLLPILFAVLHTVAGFGMISELLGVLFLYDKTLISIVGVGVSLIFAVIYCLSYVFTSKVYYKIVKQMN